MISRTSGIWHRGCFKKHLTHLELEAICYKLGFLGTTGKYIENYNTTVLVGNRPVFGTYSLVKLNNKISIGMRTGREPYLSFEKDPDCYRLFIECV